MSIPRQRYKFLARVSHNREANLQGDYRHCVEGALLKCGTCSATIKTALDYQIHQCDIVVTANHGPKLTDRNNLGD